MWQSAVATCSVPPIVKLFFSPSSLVEGVASVTVRFHDSVALFMSTDQTDIGTDANDASSLSPSYIIVGTMVEVMTSPAEFTQG